LSPLLESYVAAAEDILFRPDCQATVASRAATADGICLLFAEIFTGA